jgi:hypothetical protein
MTFPLPLRFGIARLATSLEQTGNPSLGRLDLERDEEIEHAAAPKTALR